MLARLQSRVALDEDLVDRGTRLKVAAAGKHH